MSRKRVGSIVHDVKVCLNEVDRIGFSKRDARKVGDVGMIHSLKQKEHAMSACQNFVRWVRAEFGVRKVYELEENHYLAYMGHLEDKGSSIGHRRNIETGLRHLQKGMDKRSEYFQKERCVFTPKNRITVPEPFEGVSNRSYQNEEIQALLEQVPATTSDAVKLMYGLGLRVKEAANIRVEHFVPTGTGWRVEIKNGSGVTKAGRFRQLVVPKHFEKDLLRMLSGKEPIDRLVSIKLDTIRKSVNEGFKKAGIIQSKRGCHGFRHSYARKRMTELLTKEETNLFSSCMERYMENKAFDYGVHDKKLFDNMKAKMDLVHSELGHGKNRFDLAVRYMKK